MKDFFFGYLANGVIVFNTLFEYGNREICTLNLSDTSLSVPHIVIKLSSKTSLVR